VRAWVRAWVRACVCVRVRENAIVLLQRGSPVSSVSDVSYAAPDLLYASRASFLIISSYNLKTKLRTKFWQMTNRIGIKSGT